VIANLEAFDVLAYSNDDSSDLVSWNHGENSGSPFLTSLVNVRVADTSELGADVDVVVTDGTAFEGEGDDGTVSVHCRITLGFESSS
jgi:hypothetical protein